MQISLVPTRVKKILVAAVLPIGLFPFCASQAQTPVAPSATFKSQAELVTVPVVVTDKSGNHLHGLKKEDFIVLQDGKAQTIATFEEIVKANAPDSPPPTPGKFSNVLALEPKPVNLTILVLDLVNTNFEDQSYAKSELIKYLQTTGDNPQPTSIFALTRSGLKVIHDFATDPKSLSTALQKAPHEREIVEQASQEAVPSGTPPALAAAMERIRQSEQSMESLERRVSIMLTLQAMQEIADSCAGLPGRKAMLWASGGFPLTLSELNMVMNIGGPKLDSFAEISDSYEKTWRALNQAQVSVYPVDARGLTNTTTPDATMRAPRPEFYAHAQWMNAESINTFQSFAQATGGRAFYNTNDLKNSFAKAADDNREYYMLAYYLDKEKKDPGWHRLTVHVQREGSQVRSRSGFFVTKAKTSTDTDKEVEMRTALGSPLNYTAIQFTGSWQPVIAAKEPGKKTAVFMLTMPANFARIEEDNDNHMDLEIGAVALTTTGTVAGESFKHVDGHPKGTGLDQIRNHGLDYRGGLTLPPGEYTVRFAVEDRLAGRIGTVSTHLKVDP